MLPLDIPFDQYARYEVARRVVERLRPLRGQDRFRILDVGGYFRAADGRDWLPALNCFPADDCVVLDIVPCELSGYIRYDGQKMPFGDGAFDVVICNDTLEHVPPGQRKEFLSELTRVSGGVLILTAPFYSELNVTADWILFEFIQVFLNVEHVQLKEHLQNGLPHFHDVQAQLQESGWDLVSFGSGYTPLWLNLMLFRHFLMAYPESGSLIRLLDRYINLQWFEADQNVSPAYRQVIIATKDSRGLAARIRPGFSPPQSPDSALTGLAGLQQAIMDLAIWRRHTTRQEPSIVLLANHGHEIASPPLRDGVIISQTFTCWAPRLSGIRVLVGTHQRKHYGRLLCRIVDVETGAYVRTAELPMEKLQDNTWCTFRFTPVAESAGRRYRVEFTTDAAVESVSLWMTERPHPAGAAAIGGEVAPGSVSVEVLADAGPEYSASGVGYFMNLLDQERVAAERARADAAVWRQRVVEVEESLVATQRLTTELQQRVETLAADRAWLEKELEQQKAECARLRGECESLQVERTHLIEEKEKFWNQLQAIKRYLVSLASEGASHEN